MTIAAVMTVRDERAMLRTNLLYHRFIGVDVVLLYDDGSTDGTADSIADLGFVEVRPTVGRDELGDRPELGRFLETFDTHFVARQSLNTAHAIDVARSTGIEWLVAIDADELVAVDLETAEPNSLRAFLGGQTASTEAVVIPPLEIVQRRVEYDDVIREETLFKRVDTGAERTTYDPFEKRTRKIPVVYGHSAGKSAVRLGADVVPRTSHRFVHGDGTSLNSVEGGYLLHYYSHSFDAFVHKFRLIRDHPDRHVQGDDVVYQKRLWRDVVNRSGLDDGQLLDYYQRWIMFGDAEIEELVRPRGVNPLRRRPTLVEVTSVQSALRSIDGSSDSDVPAAS